MLRVIYNKLRFPYDITDVVFRILFSLIFLGLGTEHLFSNQLIIDMMPNWLPAKFIFAWLTGIILLLGGTMILIGIKTRFAATLLGLFIIVVTLSIHGPALIHHPSDLPKEWTWLWNVYQRSNFVKNLCLLGVCFHLINHRLGKYSLDVYLKQKQSDL